MIAFATPNGRLDRGEQLEQFTSAVIRGHQLYASPAIAKTLNEAFRRHGLEFIVRESSFLDDSFVYAINCKFEQSILNAVGEQNEISNPFAGGNRM